MSAKPFTVEIGARSVTFTEFTTVPGAAYLRPVQCFRIPLASWRELIADGGPGPGRVAAFHFTPEQQEAHGLTITKGIS